MSQSGDGLSTEARADSVQTAGSQPSRDPVDQQAGSRKIRRSLERSVIQSFQPNLYNTVSYNFPNVYY